MEPSLITQKTSSPSHPVTRLQSVAPGKVCRGNPPKFRRSTNVEARNVIWADTGRTGFEAVVSTDEDQIAVAPRTLLRSWTESHRIRSGKQSITVTVRHKPAR